MNPLVIIAGIVLVPLIVLTVLRVNAAVVFLSLCLGSVLVKFVGEDANSFIGLFTNSSGYTLSVLLLLMPVVFTTLIMIRTVKGGIRSIFNLIPAAAVGVVGLLLLMPLVSPGLRGALTHTSVWHDIERARSLVVGVSTLASLFFLVLQRPKRGHEGRRHR
jgi:hypothetical protein